MLEKKGKTARFHENLQDFSPDENPFTGYDNIYSVNF